MRILTYNIAGNRGRARPDHLKRVAELILKSGADVVGLQEVIHLRNSQRGPEDLLAELTGMRATFLPAHQFREYCLGNAVLCREGITQTVSHEHPQYMPERRILLEVETCVNGLPVTIFCTHLVHGARAGARLRLAQATAVAQVMATCFRPHVLVGDLNASPHAAELHPVRKVAVRHDHLRGHHTWPARRPFILYDHIWPGPGWVVEEVQPLELHVSDHRPLFAQLGWAGAPRYHIMPDEPYLQPGAPAAPAIHATPAQDAAAPAR